MAGSPSRKPARSRVLHGWPASRFQTQFLGRWVTVAVRKIPDPDPTAAGAVSDVGGDRHPPEAAAHPGDGMETTVHHRQDEERNREPGSELGAEVFLTQNYDRM